MPASSLPKMKRLASPLTFPSSSYTGTTPPPCRQTSFRSIRLLSWPLLAINLTTQKLPNRRPTWQILTLSKPRNHSFFSDSVTPEIYSSTSTVVASRSFAASKDEADAWVEKINTTLLQFEKRKAQAGIFVHKKQPDGNKLTQIVADNHWLDITPAEFI